MIQFNDKIIAFRYLFIYIKESNEALHVHAHSPHLPALLRIFCTVSSASHLVPKLMQHFRSVNNNLELTKQSLIFNRTYICILTLLIDEPLSPNLLRLYDKTVRQAPCRIYSPLLFVIKSNPTLRQDQTTINHTYFPIVVFPYIDQFN